MTVAKLLKVFGPKIGGGRRVYPIYESFEKLMGKVPKAKGKQISPDEIVKWFKENRPNRVEEIMGTNIIEARTRYSEAKSSAKLAEKNKNPEKKIKNLVEKAKDFQKGGSVDKPLGAGG
tara:strand:+ start:144 stop:500 length:357 start_codon:yes stop_codon:yes gene_type:complete